MVASTFIIQCILFLLAKLSSNWSYGGNTMQLPIQITVNMNAFGATRTVQNWSQESRDHGAVVVLSVNFQCCKICVFSKGEIRCNCWIKNATFTPTKPILIEPHFLAIRHDSTVSLVPKSTFCLTQMDEKRINNPFILIRIKACEPAHQRSFMHANSHSWPVQKPWENLLSLHCMGLLMD